MPFVERISTPMSEPWTAWTMLFLLLCIGWAIQRQPALLRIAWQGTFARSGRNYSDAAVDALALVLVQVFRVGTLALGLDVLFFSGGQFLFTSFLLTLLLLVAVEVIKLATAWLVHFTFHLSSSFALSYMQYTYLWMLVCLPLLVVDAVSISIGSSGLITTMMAIVGGLLVVALVIKGLRLYMNRLTSIVYILLYVITVEIVPLVVSALLVYYIIL